MTAKSCPVVRWAACFLLGTALAVTVFSCTDVFTTSLASWAKRDPASLIPPVTRGNVQELLDMSRNDPDLSLTLLKGIADAGASPELQAAALQAAANASDITNALLNNIPDLSSDFSGDIELIVNRALNSMTNLGEIATVLPFILPFPSTPPAWDDFVAASTAEDLAMAAAVLLAADAKAASGGVKSITPSPLEQALAAAARSRYSGGGYLGDILDGLGF